MGFDDMRGKLETEKARILNMLKHGKGLDYHT